MQEFGNYEVQTKIYETNFVEIQKAVHKKTGTKAILKLIKSEFPSPAVIAKLNREFNILSQIDSPYIIKVYSLEKQDNRLAIAMEDIDAISLKEYRRGKFRLDEFFKIASLMVNAIKDVHKNNIIHKDINPSNFIYNSNTGVLKLIDFEISTTYAIENVILENVNVLEGTLSYISPEQTGRMNRTIDYRTDFYSLGITFYEFLTGKLPFDYSDSMELVHSHIARHAIPPCEIEPSIPIPLSDLVMKLISKTSEGRYMSSNGIQYDLAIISSGIENYIPSFTELGTKDTSSKFQIPQKLYGREKELEVLLDAFDRVVSDKSEMLLIAGYSGIGKSALVNEIYRPITEKRGYFISGKFDQYNRNIPYKAFVNIFQDLVKQLLSESQQQLEDWKQKLIISLGENAQVIVEVIPDIEIIIGEQPPLAELGVNESQNRFNLVFQTFIKVFTKPEHPLVVFLDDLQWADGASLRLMHLLMSHPSPGLFLIGAYRDNEVSTTSPLSITLEEIAGAGAILNYISLSPLSLENVTELIGDTLNLPIMDVTSLAKLVFLKTAGNPFFLNEFLKSLAQEKLISFDDKSRIWTWDIEKIEKRGFTDNVVEFMTGKIQLLAMNTQDILKLSACIGNQFDLKTVGLVAGYSIEDTFNYLHPAIMENFIILIGSISDSDFIPSSENSIEERIPEYKFAHDRVQQACYSLIPEMERAKTHFQIGRLLESRMSQEEKEDNIFSLVNQLNFGISLLQSQKERIELASLNLIASRKARASSAYQATIDYAKTGIALLGQNGWKENYQMNLAFHDLGSEVASLVGNFDLMNEWMQDLLNNASNSLDQVPIYFVKIQALASQNRLPEAIATGKYILSKLDIHFPEQPTPENYLEGMNEINLLLGERKIEELFSLPKMKDPEILSIMNIAACLIPSCYNSGSPLFPLLIILLVNLSIQFGNSQISAFSYATYGILLNNILHDIPSMDEFRHVAYRLVLEPENKLMRSATHITIGLFLLHRKFHLRETIPILQDGYQVGLETGALEFVGYNGYSLCLNSFWLGDPLPALKTKILAYRDKLREVNQLTAANYCSIFLNAALEISGKEDHMGTDFLVSRQKTIEEAKASDDRTRLFYFYIHELFVHYLFEEYELAEEDATRAREYLTAGGGTIGEVNLYAYDSLLILSQLSTQEANKQDIPHTDTKEWKRIEENQSQLEYWATYAPMNYSHKWNLVEAEKHRVLGEKQSAQDFYDRAMEFAKINNYTQEEAIANELYAKFWLQLGKKEFAQVHLKKAYYLYSSWGAKGKLALLANKYPFLNTKTNENELDYFSGKKNISKKTTESTTKMEANLSLDFVSILKASQIISGEIILSKLLGSLMKVLAENAGAEIGFLLLEENEKLFIETSWNADENKINFARKEFREDSDLLSSSIVNFVNRTKQELVIEDVTKEGKLKDSYIRKNKPKSVLCIPLLSKGKIVGIVYLENNLTSGAFTKDRIEVIKILSSQAAISIENASLYSNLESITKEKTRITTEMEIAKDIQTSLLPISPTLSGFDVATYMLTADLVGGDYFDVIQTEGREWFVIGDVSGHGVTAGLLMMMTQTAIHTILNSLETKDPALLLSKVNQVISSNIQKMKLKKYMTLTLFLKEANGSIYYSGMHQDLLLYVAKKKTVEIIETNGSWIGYYDLHNEFQVDHINMESGDVLFLFTDGITESTDIDGHMYEINGLVKILNEKGSEPVEVIKQSILKSLEDFKTEDDTTFMICKRK